jgi:hypothetical protein
MGQPIVKLFVFMAAHHLRDFSQTPKLRTVQDPISIPLALRSGIGWRLGDI